MVSREPPDENTEDNMSTQPSSPTPPISFQLEPYVDTKRAAEFLSVGRKRLQKLSREGKIPAHPVLSGPRNRRRTWRYKLSELDEWARDQGNSVPAGCATSPKEK
jgi:phage terminase Nu1 subunit (DNA packaging protein)